jgi:hypothetical protein
MVVIFCSLIILFFIMEYRLCRIYGMPAKYAFGSHGLKYAKLFFNGDYIKLNITPIAKGSELRMCLKM